MINLQEYELKADKLKAMAHPHRLCILKGLSENSCNVTKIQECLGLPQSTISQHLSKLKAAGIISGQRNGQEVCYRITDDGVTSLIKLLFNDKKM